jgi:hypothetical protein
MIVSERQGSMMGVSNVHVQDIGSSDRSGSN